MLALVQTALLAATAWDKSDTADESQYLAAAATLWANGDVAYLCGAPALPRWGAALALAAVDGAVLRQTPAAEPVRYVFAPRTPQRLRAVLFAARIPTIVVVVVGGLLLWSAARRYGETAALVTHALWCFSPTVLANGSLATLDAWAAAALAALLWALVRFRERPTIWGACVAGAACGAAAACKMTALGAMPMAILAVALASPPGRRARAVLALAMAAGTTIWAAYGFSVGVAHLAAPCAANAVGGTGPLPAPAWLEGVAFQLRHGQLGHLGYLFGMVGTCGWWWFYLACLALKVTVGAQALALLAAAALVRRPRRASVVRTAVLLAYPLALVVALSASSHQGGIAFLLPALPFVALAVGAAVDDVTRAFGRWGRTAALACVALGAVEALHVHPHYLMFFNVWAGGPAGGPRYLVHRDDWGQDDRRLAVWQREHRVPRVYFAAYGANAARWGVVADPVPCVPTPGVYALHAVEVHRPQFSLAPGCVDWLTVEPPDERLGYSIYVYDVDEARLARLERARATTPPFWRSGVVTPSN